MRFSLRYPVIKLSRLLHYYIDRGSILSYNSEQRDDNGWMNFKFLDHCTLFTNEDGTGTGTSDQ